MAKIITEDNHTLEDDSTLETGAAVVRNSGRFAQGNQEGRKFQKGYPGKPKGVRNRKNVIAREFAEDVLYLDPATGKRMTYHQLCIYIKKKADASPRILNLLLDHYLGKPVEHVQHQVVPTFIFQKVEPPGDKAQDAQVIEEEQFILPEGKKLATKKGRDHC